MASCLFYRCSALSGHGSTAQWESPRQKLNDNKAMQRQLDELQRHSRIIHGVYLAPYKDKRHLYAYYTIEGIHQNESGVWTMSRDTMFTLF
ncbi:PREDICTED: uncharacterized protein LOC105155048 isoform X2 [Acromyrmex echinatior]|uniref:uncharacterized protein LOC105155048 isoform X2 n=1 Tax=Acromyrmex echinatior TaxID=103372 RepID=UPI000580BF2C|nr:PREDICTED: uncharacterized protein LOC105155048 isoform X2 [Acromyrmex echinatior]